MKPQTVGAILTRSAGTGASRPMRGNPQANPQRGSPRFAGYRSTGVNRVSLGVQALDRCLGEAWTACIRRARRSPGGDRRKNFERYSFDLILPADQTPGIWADEPEKLAISEAAEHLSLYQLTIEEARRFSACTRGQAEDPDERARALYDVNAGGLRYGLPAYEISNHARAVRRVQHNLVYWPARKLSGVVRRRMAPISTRQHAIAPKSPRGLADAVEPAGHGVVTTTF